MFAQLVGAYHLHPLVDHFTIALLTFGIVAEMLAAVVILLCGDQAGVVSGWGQKLRSAALLLIVAGAVASVLSYLSGDEEADRLWDTMSPAARQILVSSNGPDYLSHAVLGQRLMYVFLVLAAWRMMLELWKRLESTRIVFLIASMIAAAALLYQGKTGGELVYEHGVGTARMTVNAQQIAQQPEGKHALHTER